VTSRHPAPSPVATAAKLPPPPLLWGGEATNPHHPVHPVSKVPIRASPVRARRPEYRSPQSTISEFQSAPRPCGRGDVCAVHLQVRSPCVSIRASPVRARRPWANSPPSPCARGDQRGIAGGGRLGLFQSAPRPCGRGDADKVLTARGVSTFQSAPRPCGRGDGLN